jgi:MTH538 TIR-like domain (DUF1863)
VLAQTSVRVFLSYDVDHDRDLGERFSDQSQRGGSGFCVESRSEAGAMTDRWHAGVRRRMRNADEIVVICGEHTAASERMHTELRIAQEEQKPFLLLWGRRERMCSMPVGVKRTACMYTWTWETLVHLVAQTLRDAQPLEIPENCKRR